MNNFSKSVILPGMVRFSLGWGNITISVILVLKSPLSISQRRDGLEGPVLSCFWVDFDPQVTSLFLTSVVHVMVYANAHLMIVLQKRKQRSIQPLSCNTNIMNCLLGEVHKKRSGRAHPAHLITQACAYADNIQTGHTIEKVPIKGPHLHKYG